jgi:hypothetical protein
MRALAAIGLVLLLTACGGKADRPAAAPEPQASLRVSHVLDPHAKALYMEGSIWHVRVLDVNGKAVLDRKTPEDSVSVRLAAGRYRIESEELPCDGTCSHLDPAMDSCSSELDLHTGDALAGKVILTPARGCTIAF